MRLELKNIVCEAYFFTNLLPQGIPKNLLWRGIVIFLLNSEIIFWNEHRRSFKC
jgi:hypothetical protein